MFRAIIKAVPLQIGVFKKRGINREVKAMLTKKGFFVCVAFLFYTGYALN